MKACREKASGRSCGGWWSQERKTKNTEDLKLQTGWRITVKRTFCEEGCQHLVALAGVELLPLGLRLHDRGRAISKWYVFGDFVCYGTFCDFVCCGTFCDFAFRNGTFVCNTLRFIFGDFCFVFFVQITHCTWNMPTGCFANTPCALRPRHRDLPVWRLQSRRRRRLPPS